VLEGTNNGPNLSIMINTYTGYNYDGVNRLIAANDNNWSRSFGYDPYGNMWVTGATGITPSSLTPTGSNGYNANNQLTVNAGYDASGNQTTFGVNAMTYDAESRQIGVSNTNPGMQATYSYDGEGKRVMRSINGASTTYVYDAAGELAAEYDSAPPAVPPCTTCYLSWDHLGSTRLVTDQSDNVVSRHDYLPFGEEIAAGVGGRTSVWGASDLVTQKFTSKERDTESGLDYFGARYYGGVLGRFGSADEPLADQSPGDPQSWNLYGYVRNNPLSRVDPNGRSVCDAYHAIADMCDSEMPDPSTTAVELIDIAAQRAATPIPTAPGKYRSHRKEKVGSRAYLEGKSKDNYKAGTNKCNELCADAVQESGRQRPQVNRSGILGALGLTRDPTVNGFAAFQYLPIPVLR
jgi:RHS repeat-associated protein